jgi:hypothetical protein
MGSMKGENMVYLWRIPEEYPQSLIGEYQHQGTPDRFLFKKGEVIAETVGLPIVKFNASVEVLRDFHCLSSNATVPLISTDCARILQEMAPANIQLFKAHIVANDGMIDEFFLLNVTSKVICIDKDKSKFKFIPGTQQIMSFRKLVFLEECLGTHGVARDSEYLAHVLVSEVIRKRLMANNMKGIGLFLPEEVAW